MTVPSAPHPVDATLVDPLPGDLFVVQTRGAAARVIEFGTLSEFNHAAICDGRGNVIEAQPGGVVRTPLSDYDGDPRLFSTGVLPLPDALRPGVIAFAQAALGAPYDWWNIAYFAATARTWVPGWLETALAGRLRREWTPATADTRVAQVPHATICSALASAAWLAVGLEVCPGKAPWQTTPGDIAAALSGGTIPTRY